MTNPVNQVNQVGSGSSDESVYEKLRNDWETLKGLSGKAVPEALVSEIQGYIEQLKISSGMAPVWQNQVEIWSRLIAEIANADNAGRGYDASRMQCSAETLMTGFAQFFGWDSSSSPQSTQVGSGGQNTTYEDCDVNLGALEMFLRDGTPVGPYLPSELQNELTTLKNQIPPAYQFLIVAASQLCDAATNPQVQSGDALAYAYDAQDLLIGVAHMFGWT
jgi:hypothetical protein